MERWREIKLSKGQQWRRERELEEVENHWGRRPLKRGSKDRAVGGGKVAAPTARPWPSLAGHEPEAPALARPRLAKLQDHPTRKRTYFDHLDSIFMFLGSLETQRSALQDHAEKHHCSTREDKTK